MSKKLLAILAALSVVTLVGACGSDPSNSSSGAGESSSNGNSVSSSASVEDSFSSKADDSSSVKEDSSSSSKADDSSSSKEDSSSEKEEHTHTYVWVDETEATCEHIGMQGHYICGDETCGESFDADKNVVDIASLIIPKADHVYYYVDNGDGTHSKKCDGCKDETKGAHAYTREVVDEKYLKSAADCFNAAMYYRSCVCGKFDDSEEAITFFSGEKAGHNFVNGVCESCHIDLNAITQAIAALPEADALTLADVKKTQETYEQYVVLDEEARAQVTGGEKLEALYKKVGSIATLSGSLWSNDSVHGSAVTFTTGEDATYGEYAELTHTAGWAFVHLNAEGVLPEGNVVFYAYNPAETDLTITYGHMNDSKSDGVFGGVDRYHALLKAKAWTRVSFAYNIDYPVHQIRFVAGDQAGDGTNLSGVKFTAWYLVKDVATITDLVYDKSIEYTYVEKTDASCENTGVAAHYTSGENFYNEYKEKVSEAELTIPALGHSYGDDGVCTACGASLKPIIDAIDALPAQDELCVADIAKIKTVYAQYDALSDAAKALIKNGDTLIALYALVENIETYSTNLAHGGQNSAAMTFTTGGYDDVYGEYTEITHTSDWANFKSDIALTPENKTVVWYVYNPLDSDRTLCFGTSSTIYGSEGNLHFVLKANAWTKVAIKWTYTYQITNGVFLCGEQAGDYTLLTGMKFSATYIVDDASVLDVFAPKKDVKPLIANIDKLPEKTNLTLASIASVKSLYAEYSNLTQEEKAIVTNATKLLELYEVVKDITIYSTNLAHGGQNSAAMTFTTGGNDDVYGEYTEITHTSDWANFKSDIALTPENKTVVWYVYNPLDSDRTLCFGTSSTIYGSEGNLHFVLKANAWTKVAIKWTYAYQITNGVFLCGEQAGDDYDSLTGMKFSATYIVDDASVFENF